MGELSVVIRALEELSFLCKSVSIRHCCVCITVLSATLHPRILEIQNLFDHNLRTVTTSGLETRLEEAEFLMESTNVALQLHSLPIQLPNLPKSFPTKLCF